jgi:hypothetical protein
LFTNDANYIVSGSNVSNLNNDAGYLTTVTFGDLTSTPTTLSGYGITDAATSAQGDAADSAVQPGSNISVFNNDAGYITLANIQNGDVTVDVNNTGDLVGSVFGDDSVILVDSLTSSVNLDGTIKGHVVPNLGEFWDIGSSEKEFRNVYISGILNGNTAGLHTGDVKGSVFADDSTLLVDGVAGKIVGNVENSQVKTNLIWSLDDADLGIYGTTVTSAGDGNDVGMSGGTNLGSGDAGGVGIYGGLSSGGQGGNIFLWGGQGANGGGNLFIQGGTGLLGSANGKVYFSREVDFSAATVINFSANVTGDLTGSVFADDSTLLVDGVAGKIVGEVNTSYVTTANGISFGSTNGYEALVDEGGTLYFKGTNGDNDIIVRTNASGGGQNDFIFGKDGSLTFPDATVQTTAWTGVGDLTGSVFADDSTLLVDAVNGEIPGYVKIADLKTALQDGAGDYAAFKAWVLANL